MFQIKEAFIIDDFPLKGFLLHGSQGIPFSSQRSTIIPSCSGRPVCLGSRETEVLFLDVLLDILFRICKESADGEMVVEGQILSFFPSLNISMPATEPNQFIPVQGLSCPFNTIFIVVLLLPQAFSCSADSLVSLTYRCQQRPPWAGRTPTPFHLLIFPSFVSPVIREPTNLTGVFCRLKRQGQKQGMEQQIGRLTVVYTEQTWIDTGN